MLLAVLTFMWGDCVIIDKATLLQDEKAAFHGCIKTSGIAEDFMFDKVQVKLSCKSGIQYLSFPKDKVSKCTSL